MKFSVLIVWLVFTLCGNCLSNMAMAIGGTSTSHLGGFNITKSSRMQLQVHVQGRNGTITLEEESDGLKHKEKQEIFHSVRAGKRGKVSNGGANIVHRPGPEKNTASLTARPCFGSVASPLYLSLALMAVPTLFTGLVQKKILHH